MDQAIDHTASPAISLRLRSALFAPQCSIWRYVGLMSVAVVIIGLAVQLIVFVATQALGVNTTMLHSSTDFGSIGRRTILTVLIAPVLETAALLVLLHVLLLVSKNLLGIAVISGLMWGAYHGRDGVLHFFGPAVGFFLFSCAYLAWYHKSRAEAYFAAAVPHAFSNAVLIAIVAWRSSVA